MGRNGGNTWERKRKGRVLVTICIAGPPEEVTGLLQGLHAQGQVRGPQEPLPPTSALKPSRSFGRLPPGNHPHWQSREWIGFTLWLIVVVGLLLGAVYRNASYFF
jgi:hypothetical protein